MGPKSCRRVRTDFSNTVHTAWWGAGVGGRGGGGGEGEGEEGELAGKGITRSRNIFNKPAALPLYLHHLRVTEPPAEEPLDQGEHLLQHNHHLERNQDVSHVLHRRARLEAFPQTPTGFCAPPSEEEEEEEGSGWLEAPSQLSACLPTSRVVKRLDSIPRMWMMDCFVVGPGCQGHGEREER